MGAGSQKEKHRWCDGFTLIKNLLECECMDSPGFRQYFQAHPDIEKIVGTRARIRIITTLPAFPLTVVLSPFLGYKKIVVQVMSVGVDLWNGKLHGQCRIPVELL